MEELETAAYDRALKGNASLLAFLLRAWKPEVYNLPARQQIRGHLDGPLNLHLAEDLVARLNGLAVRAEDNEGEDDVAGLGTST